MRVQRDTVLSEDTMYTYQILDRCKLREDVARCRKNS